MDSWDPSALEAFFCRLEPNELCICGSVCRSWCLSLEPSKCLPWRVILQRLCPGLHEVSRHAEASPNGGHVLVKWSGVRVLLPASPQLDNAPRQLWALPLRAALERNDMDSAGPEEFAMPSSWDCNVDYRSLARNLSHWCSNSDAALPVCPMCAGVAFYQGPLFTRSDIQTGWHAFLLCASKPPPKCSPQSAATPSLLAATWANMGIPESQGPPIAVQLRPLGEQADPGPADALSIDCLGELWRGVGCRMAEFLLSVAVPSGHRLCVNSHPFEDLGVKVFFCDQVGKYALTSRTRVGRYLDDQPALHPRAHVFGVAGDCNHEKFPISTQYKFELLRDNPYVTIVNNYKHGHINHSINIALELVKTDFVYIVQHDFEFIRHVDHPALISAMRARPSVLQIVRFSKRKVHHGIHPPHCKLNETEFTVPATSGNKHIDLLRCGWSDNNHLTTKAYYVKLLKAMGPVPRAPEGVMMYKAGHSQDPQDCNYAHQYVYNWKDGPFLRHLDGRGTTLV